MSRTDTVDGIGARNFAILITVCLGVIVLPLSITGMGVAMPEIGNSLHTSLMTLQWALNGYSLVFTSLLLSSGSLADIVGRRRMFRIGTALFCLGSLACAFAGNGLMLDLGRLVAGAGAAAAVPSGSATLVQVFQGPARAKAFGIFGTTLGIGLALGPTLAGLLTNQLGWRAVFALPALCGLLALTFSGLLPESHNPNRKSVDWAGTVTYTAALASLTFAVIEGPQAGWGSAPTLGGLVAAVVLLVLFTVVERRQQAPVLDLTLLKNRQFLGLSLRVVFSVVAFSPLLTYLPTYLVEGQNHSPQQAGLIVLLMTAPIVFIPTLTGYLTRWIQPLTQIVLILVLGGIGLAWMTVIGPTGGVARIAGPLVLFGISMGISFGLSDATVMSSIPAERAGMASGLFNTMRIGAEMLGIAVFGSILVSVTAASLTHKSPAALGSYAHNPSGLANDINAGRLGHVQGTGSLADLAHTAAVGSYTTAMHVVLWIMALLSLAGAPLVAWLIWPGRRAGEAAEKQAGPAERTAEPAAR